MPLRLNDRAPRSAQHPFDGTEALCALALGSLRQMYRPEKKRFAFRLRQAHPQAIVEGTSFRYTAIVVIGLARAPKNAVKVAIHGDTLENVCADLRDEAPRKRNLGDAALALWAAQVVAVPGREVIRRRLEELLSHEARPATVEAAWALTALCLEPESVDGGKLRDDVAQRLLDGFVERSGLFPHRLGGRGGGPRAHVACFADLVYPIQALAHYHKATGHSRPLEIAEMCAARMCASLGKDGQWWWHYDVRTGGVVEGYPVYAVHQDAMAPMALLDLEEAGGSAHPEAIARGLSWLKAAPELDGGTLIDESAEVIWRKVARREPRKLTRRLQALASRAHPTIRVPGLNTVFPPGAVDYESRPYHAGWLLYAWLRAGQVE